MSDFLTSLRNNHCAKGKCSAARHPRLRPAASAKRALWARELQFADVAVLGVTLALGVIILTAASDLSGYLVTAPWIWIVSAFVLVVGVLMTLPRGKSMPSVISVYQAIAGLAVGLEGVVFQNPALMITGMVVGAAGLVLLTVRRRSGAGGDQLPPWPN